MYIGQRAPRHSVAQSPQRPVRQAGHLQVQAPVPRGTRGCSMTEFTLKLSLLSPSPQKLALHSHFSPASQALLCPLSSEHHTSEMLGS